MPVSKARKKQVVHRAVQSRHRKALYLPMPRPDANRISLRYHLALEAIRSGRADREAAINMASVVLLTEYMTEDGYGMLPLGMLHEAGRHLSDMLAAGVVQDTWYFPGPFIEELTAIVNEHDRQLRENRMHVVLTASEKLDHLIQANPIGLLQSD